MYHKSLLKRSQKLIIFVKRWHLETLMLHSSFECVERKLTLNKDLGLTFQNAKKLFWMIKWRNFLLTFLLFTYNMMHYLMKSTFELNCSLKYIWNNFPGSCRSRDLWWIASNEYRKCQGQHGVLLRIRWPIRFFR